MESFTDPNVSETVLMMGSQLGKTETMINAMLYVVDNHAANILVKYPTIDAAKKFSQKKLTPAINAIPRIREKFKDPRTRDSGNRILDKRHVGGTISLIGANSTTDLRGQTCSWIIQDEIDSDETTAEGDAMALADMRAENFHDATFIKASTPTVKGQSRIQKLYDDSDRSEWKCPCPRCNHFQVLRFSQIRYMFPGPDGKEESQPERAVYVCENCKAELSDAERIKMVQKGDWYARFPMRTRKGFQLSGMNRIMGKKRTYRSYLHEFVVKFLKAKEEGPESLQVWTNTFLSECYEPDLQKLDVNPIISRREAYGPELPRDVLVLTASVDSQIDRLECLIGGWGIQDEWWGVKMMRVMGDPFDVHVWKELDEILNEPIEHPVFGSLKVKVTLVDSGGQINSRPFTLPVYSFVRPRQPLESGPGVYACKGANAYLAEIVTTTRPSPGIALKRIGTTAAKSALHARFKLTGNGPRRIHFPDGCGFDRDFFDQLGAEAPREVKRHGYTHVIWEKINDSLRNEALDLMCYQIAAKEVLNPDMMAIYKKLLAREAELARHNVVAPAPVVPTEESQAQAKPLVQSPRQVRPLPRKFKLQRPGFRPQFRPRFG
jgi:phage terminase large subunit GpA-like protein